MLSDEYSNILITNLVVMATNTGIGVNTAKGGGISWSSYWPRLSEVLFFGEISKIADGKLYNQKVGATDYLTVGGLPGSYTFQCPDTAVYITADSEYVWFNPGAELREVSESELIGYDFARTIVKYEDVSDYSIQAIMILKGDYDTDKMRDDFHLSLWWDGTLSDHGYLKGNRGIGKSVWQIQMPFVSDLNLLIESRSGLSLPATIGSDGSIIPAISSLNGTNNYLHFGKICSTNKSFDITLTAIWNVGNYRGGLCAYSNNNQLGRVDSTSTKISFEWYDLSLNSIFSSGSGNMTIVNGTPVTVRIIKDDDAKTITLIKDGVTIIDHQAWNAAFLNNVNNLNWYLGRWFSASYCGMQAIYMKVIGDAGINEWYFNGMGTYEYDIYGAFVAQWSGTEPHVAHNVAGGTNLLDAGFKVYTKAGRPDEYVPINGSVTAIVANGYAYTRTISGSASYHNLAHSLIQFAGAFWDRSNATIWGAAARGGYYDATSAVTKKRWHISELNQNTLNNWANEGYKGLGFIKMINNSVNDRVTLDKIFGYDTEKTGDSLNGVLTYTNDIGLL